MVTIEKKLIKIPEVNRTVYKRKCPNLLILLANKLATLITIKGSAAIIQVRDNQSQQPGNIVLTRQ